MKKTLVLLSLAAACSVGIAVAQNDSFHKGHINQRNGIRRVLLISVDGMHAVDFQNCANGISTANNGAPYCPAIAAVRAEGTSVLPAVQLK